MNKTFDFSNINYDDSKVWDLICSGNTVSLFQCESKLLQHWLKKIKPRNIWELSAVIAVVRPGALMSGFADDYANSKNKKQCPKSFGHHIIDDILSNTEYCLIYQESLLHLGNKLAWKNLPEKERLLKSDFLRKSIGKKDSQKIMSVGKEFVEGCVKNGVSQEIADRLFDIIKKSGRYLFNLSHSTAYAYLCYETAYTKCYFPLHTYATYLTYARYKLDPELEIQKIFNEMQKLGFILTGPNINSKNLGAKIEGNTIRYGLRNIKYFGNKDGSLIKKLPKFEKWQQVIILGLTDIYGLKLPAPTIEALICSGAFRDIKLSRRSLLNIYQFFRKIKPREVEYLIENFSDCDSEESLRDLVNQCINDICNEKQAEVLSAHLQSLSMKEFDSPSWVEEMENFYLSIPITSVSVDSKDTTSFNTCRECWGDGHKQYTKKTIAIVLKEIKESEIKNGNLKGQKMAKLSVYDNSGNLDHLPLFPDTYNEYMELLIPKNTLALTLQYNKRGWVVEKINQL